MNVEEAVSLLKQYYSKVDEWMDQVPEDMGQKPSCHKGCANCCEQLVLASLPECLVALSDIKNIKQWESYRNWLLKKSKEHVKKLIEIKGNEGEWFKLGMRCVFLNHADACAIYNNRPLVCRTHISFDDPEKCRSSSDVKSIDPKPAVNAGIQICRRLSKELGIHFDKPLSLFNGIQLAIICHDKGLEAMKEKMVDSQLMMVGMNNDK